MKFVQLNYPSNPSLAKLLIACSQETLEVTVAASRGGGDSADRIKARSFGVLPSTCCSMALDFAALERIQITQLKLTLSRGKLLSALFQL
jgi:hypothetical protein